MTFRYQSVMCNKRTVGMVKAVVFCVVLVIARLARL